MNTNTIIRAMLHTLYISLFIMFMLLGCDMVEAHTPVANSMVKSMHSMKEDTASSKIISRSEARRDSLRQALQREDKSFITTSLNPILYDDIFLAMPRLSFGFFFHDRFYTEIELGVNKQKHEAILAYNTQATVPFRDIEKRNRNIESYSLLFGSVRKVSDVLYIRGGVQLTVMSISEKYRVFRQNLSNLNSEGIATVQSDSSGRLFSLVVFAGAEYVVTKRLGMGFEVHFSPYSSDGQVPFQPLNTIGLRSTFRLYLDDVI